MRSLWRFSLRPSPSADLGLAMTSDGFFPLLATDHRSPTAECTQLARQKARNPPNLCRWASLHTKFHASSVSGLRVLVGHSVLGLVSVSWSVIGW